MEFHPFSLSLYLSLSFSLSLSLSLSHCYRSFFPLCALQCNVIFHDAEDQFSSCLSGNYSNVADPPPFTANASLVSRLVSRLVFSSWCFKGFLYSLTLVSQGV